MAFNLINSLQDLIGSQFSSKASNILGESETNVSKGLSAIIPTVLMSILNKGGENSNFSLGNIFNQFTGTDDVNLMDGLNSLAGNNGNFGSTISELLSTVFGGKQNDVNNEVSRFSGLKSTSVTALLSLAVPYILNYLKKQFLSTGTTSEPQMLGFLNEQKSNILAALPAGLNVGNILGFSNSTTNSNINTRTTIVDEPTYNDEPKRGGKGILWVLLLAAAALLLWWLFGKDGCNDKNTKTPTKTEVKDTVKKNDVNTTTTNTSKLDAQGNYIWDVGNEIVIKLADGTELKVGENSTEAKLFKFLSDANAKVSDDKKIGWITLDRVYFETNKDVLTANSQQQLKNIAAILKNFPTAKIKFGGYTDNTGSDDINKPLSEKRAKMAANELTKLGVAAAHVESEGYGSQHPICPANDTDECKAQNRRVDIRVTAK